MNVLNNEVILKLSLSKYLTPANTWILTETAHCAVIKEEKVKNRHFYVNQSKG